MRLKECRNCGHPCYETDKVCPECFGSKFIPIPRTEGRKYYYIAQGWCGTTVCCYAHTRFHAKQLFKEHWHRATNIERVSMKLLSKWFGPDIAKEGWIIK